VTGSSLRRYREIAPERVAEWVEAGFRQRDFFPNRAFFLHKAAPDGCKLAVRSGFRPAHEELWEAVLFASSPALDGLPDELLFDDDVMWHRQHFFLPGQVAVASVLVHGSQIYTAAHHSDLVQRISRRRQYKTPIDARFHGWDRMLLNSILGYAIERGVAVVNVPTAEYARHQTDASRTIERELFDRVYDRHVVDNYRVHANGRWWAIGIAENRDRILLGAAGAEPAGSTKAICLCHDIERGHGHEQAEPEFVAIADRVSGAALDAMLDAERARGIRATYNVVGTIVQEVRGPIESAGHCLGFHTFDHALPVRAHRARSLLARRLHVGTTPGGTPSRLQLGRCRTVDYRLKGYRPARSRLGADTAELDLAYHNFEWLASSARSLAVIEPRIERGIVKIPIRFDDFPLHQGMPYAEWEARVFDYAEQHEFLALSLHDCYGPTWLEHYDSFLGRLQDAGTMKTLDAVAAEVTLADAF